MVFSSAIFLFAFLPLCLLGYYLIRSEMKNLFLVAASLLFYTWGEPKFSILLLISILVNYIFAIWIDNNKSNKGIRILTLILVLAYNLGMLFYFKYLAFTVSSINAITGENITINDIALPLGISFFTFRAISYILDVYFESTHAQKNIVNVALYISFFPHVSMGPIQKYSKFESQFENRHTTFENLSIGVKRVILGLAKKVIISNSIAIMVDKAYGMSSNELTVALAWMGAIGYMIQLYFDFSGYSDIAIGLSNMFGFECEENFNYPYIAKSIVDFWARWHISLGNWLKDYLYTPVFRSILGKVNPISKKTFNLQSSDIIALLITWLFCGMWHGAGGKFLIYGLYYYIFIVGERIYQSKKKKRAKKLKIPKRPPTKRESIRAHTYAIIVVMFGQIIFRAENMSQVFSYIGSMFGMHGNALFDAVSAFLWKENWMLFAIGISLSLPIIPNIKKICDIYVIPKKISNIVSPILYIAVLIISIAYMLTSTYQSFIYFKF